MPEQLKKINPIQLGLTVLLFALILGFIPAENGMDIDATISKVGGLIIFAQFFNWATARRVILDLEKENLGRWLNDLFDKGKLIITAVDSATATPQNVVNVNPAPPAVSDNTVLLDQAMLDEQLRRGEFRR